MAHELGHYHLEHHHAYLTHGGKSHASINEFRSMNIIEREADSFAASLLLPTRLVKPIVNSGELSVERLEGIADDFQTSLVSTAIRCVQLSHFPCALVGIRQGAVAWTFPSEALIDAGIYPNKGVLPQNAMEPWAEFQLGIGDRSENEGRVRDWFNTYERNDLGRVFVTEEYIPVTSMGMLLVLITMNESDVFLEEEEEYEDDD
ncbi:MAG: ImmA/IrrE family metallo-endopeptidase [Pirellulales bacterium]